MNFKTLYDSSAGHVDYFISFLLAAYPAFIIGVCLLVSGIFTLLSYKKDKENSKFLPGLKKLLIGSGFTSIAILFFLMFLGKQLLNIKKAKRIMTDHTFSVVEGVPENYHPMPEEGHDMERFDIGGVHFEYSDYDFGDIGYHNAASLGGVIKPGNYYRLTYYVLHNDLDSNRILKIEIKD